ncbi:Hypothetical_protein [Hexamita inflata]|uniref:Hypothetical_protein n=1 Tax=Hexamita inflata TaxID=28002 RepID=A0AA86PVN1_9EUKA|nr:Hypothetical protein HINF_LOCUS33508 [Hexamita inflata]
MNIDSQILIKDAKILYNVTSTDLFIGIAQTNYITLLHVLIKYNVTNSIKNYGITNKLSNAIFNNVELTGKINNAQFFIRGIAGTLGGYFQIQNVKYSLQLSNIVNDTAALVKDMSGASSVTITNIVFEGYTRLNAISFSYIKGSNQCITGSQNIGSDGMCYCYDTATPQLVNSVRVCKCPGSQTLNNNKCV